MKKLFITLVTLICSTVMAKEVVTIVYPFGPGDTIAAPVRRMVEEANKIQNKYVFIFDVKPGAGNAIAANYVKNNPATSILNSSSAFFIRPIFYPESYNLTEFRGFISLCEAPFAVSSVKYKSWSEVPKDVPLTIGTSGLGVTSHLVANQIQLSYPNLTVVPYKSTQEALLAVAGKQIDLNIGFVGEQEQWSGDNSKVKVNILGVTGTKSINKHPTLISSGFPATMAVATLPINLIVSANVPEEKFQEWRSILGTVAKLKDVQTGFAVDYCVLSPTMTDKEVDTWYKTQVERWKRLSSGIVLNN